MNKWIDASLEVPPSHDHEISIYVLIITHDYHIMSGFVDFENEWYDSHGDNVETVTHWQPLPEMPNE